MKIIKRVLVMCLMTGLVLTNGLGTYVSYAKKSDVIIETKVTETVVMKTTTIGKKTWYLVENEEQLRAIGTGEYSMSANYMLNCDIYLSDAEWVPIGSESTPFRGTLNGNGCEIWNLTMKSPTAKLIGFLGYATGATICNVTLRDLEISKAGGVGKSVGAIVVFGINCNIYDNEVYSKDN